MAQALADILSLRYMDLLREDEGGTYGASAYGSVTKRPNEQANLWVQFDCNPDKVEKLVAIVHSELKKVAAGVISEADLEKTKNNYLKENKQQQDYNSYEMSLLVNFYREGYNMNSSKNFEDIVKNLKVKDIKTFAKKLLANAKSYEIIIKPLKDSIEKMESK